MYDIHGVSFFYFVNMYEVQKRTICWGTDGSFFLGEGWYYELLFGVSLFGVVMLFTVIIMIYICKSDIYIL